MEKMAQELNTEAAPKQFGFAQGSVSDSSVVDSQFEQARSFFGGPLDVLVANAGEWVPVCMCMCVYFLNGRLPGCSRSLM